MDSGFIVYSTNKAIVTNIVEFSSKAEAKAYMKKSDPHLLDLTCRKFSEKRIDESGNVTYVTEGYDIFDIDTFAEAFYKND